MKLEAATNSTKRTLDGGRRPSPWPRPLRARLHILGSTALFEFSGDRCRIGSDETCDLVLEDEYVSRHHCELLWRDDGVWLVDNDSRNGTFVNGTLVGECQLTPGARIALGRTRLKLLGSHAANPHGIIGEHPRVRTVLQRIAQLGPRARSVLVLGETGTGKELVARALHDVSAHHQGPFEAINCAAIPAQLAESLLFGHVRGAFTGADQASAGAFRRADRGTLFLDEVGEMPLELQPKLLRVLEDGLVRPVGGEPCQVDVRVIAATHRDLAAAAACGRFRLDLYHRLAVGVVALPPLRERVSDIPLLARHFLRALGDDYRLSPAAERALMRERWSGNVRALKHALESATLVGGPHLEPEDFDLTPASALGTAPLTAANDGMVRVEGRSMREIQGSVYRYALRRCGGNRSRAAALLSVPKSTFFDHLRALSIAPGDEERDTGELALGA